DPGRAREELRIPIEGEPRWRKLQVSRLAERHRDDHQHGDEEEPEHQGEVCGQQVAADSRHAVVGHREPPSPVMETNRRSARLATATIAKAATSSVMPSAEPSPQSSVSLICLAMTFAIMMSL